MKIINIILTWVCPAQSGCPGDPRQNSEWMRRLWNKLCQSAACRITITRSFILTLLSHLWAALLNVTSVYGNLYESEIGNQFNSFAVKAFKLREAGAAPPGQGRAAVPPRASLPSVHQVGGGGGGGAPPAGVPSASDVSGGCPHHRRHRDVGDGGGRRGVVGGAGALAPPLHQLPEPDSQSHQSPARAVEPEGPGSGEAGAGLARDVSVII